MEEVRCSKVTLPNEREKKLFCDNLSWLRKHGFGFCDAIVRPHSFFTAGELHDDYLERDIPVICQCVHWKWFVRFDLGDNVFLEFNNRYELLSDIVKEAQKAIRKHFANNKTKEKDYTEYCFKD